MVTRDDNPDDVVLPRHMTMQRCYTMWCWKRGWKVEKFSQGQNIYKKVSEYEKWKNDDEEDVSLWPTGSEYKLIIAWPTFHKLWKKNSPSLNFEKKGMTLVQIAILY